MVFVARNLPNYMGLAALIAAALALAGCAGDRTDIFQISPASAYSGSDGEAAGADRAGLLGARLASALGKDDLKYAYVAQIKALNEAPAGAPSVWRNIQSGASGTIVTGPLYQIGEQTCRSFTHTVYLGGRPLASRGSACQISGGWQSVS